MDKDRIKGSAEQAKGAVKETVGKAFGDKKLETEGKTDKAAGKVQNAIGGIVRASFLRMRVYRRRVKADGTTPKFGRQFTRTTA